VKVAAAISFARDSELADLSARLTAAQLETELLLVGAVLGDCRRESCAIGVAMAEHYGVTPDLLDSPDLQQILAAAFLCSHLPLGEALVKARSGLKSQKLWDPSAPAHSRGMAWSNESLASYSEDFCGPTWLAVLAPRFIDLRSRRLRADAAYRELRSALELEPFPFHLGTHRRLPMVTNAPSSRSRIAG
jgi:hypothetical protein